MISAISPVFLYYANKLLHINIYIPQREMQYVTKINDIVKTQRGSGTERAARLNAGERMAIRLMEAVPAACEESNTENRASGFKTEAVSAPHGEAEVSLKADAEAATAGWTLVM